jgi:hypothetical protein
MTTNNRMYKDPEAVLDFSINWENWLDGDTISTSSWTVPSGITNDLDSVIGDTTFIWLSGGTAGNLYEVVNHITTEAGRETYRTLKIRCKNL